MNRKDAAKLIDVLERFDLPASASSQVLGGYLTRLTWWTSIVIFNMSKSHSHGTGLLAQFCAEVDCHLDKLWDKYAGTKINEHHAQQ